MHSKDLALVSRRNEWITGYSFEPSTLYIAFAQAFHLLKTSGRQFKKLIRLPSSRMLRHTRRTAWIVRLTSSFVVAAHVTDAWTLPASDGLRLAFLTLRTWTSLVRQSGPSVRDGSSTGRSTATSLAQGTEPRRQKRCTTHSSAQPDQQRLSRADRPGHEPNLEKSRIRTLLSPDLDAAISAADPN
jgi:hypothetical protein